MKNTNLHDRNKNYLTKKLKAKLYKNEDLTVADKLFADMLIKEELRNLNGSYGFNPFALYEVSDKSWNVKAWHYKNELLNLCHDDTSIPCSLENELSEDEQRVVILKTLFNYLSEAKKKKSEFDFLRIEFREYINDCILNDKSENLVAFDNSNYKITLSISKRTITLKEKETGKKFIMRPEIDMNYVVTEEDTRDIVQEHAERTLIPLIGKCLNRK